MFYNIHLPIQGTRYKVKVARYEVSGTKWNVPNTKRQNKKDGNFELRLQIQNLIFLNRGSKNQAK